MKQIVLLLLLITLLSAREQGGFETKGSFYSDLSLLHYHNSDAADSLGFSGITTLSLNMRNRNRKHAKVDAAFEIKMPYGNGWDSVPLPGDSGTESIPLSDFILASYDKSVLLLDLRRFYAELYFNRLELSLGRQYIGFGEGQIFSPVDQFSSVDMSDFRYRKNGADVLHVEIAFGDLSGVTAAVEFPYGEREHSSALKFYGTLKSFDLALVGIYRHQEETVLPGFSFKGDVFVGLYGEGVFEIPVDGAAFFNGMIGLDYSLANKWFFVSEYQFLGEDEEHSVFASVDYSINELLTTGGSVIHTVRDKRSTATARFSWNLLQNADLTTFIRGYKNSLFGDRSYDLDYSLRVSVKF